MSSKKNKATVKDDNLYTFTARGCECEVFYDIGYYDMVCVRNKSDRNFNSPLSFHFNTREQADSFAELLKVSS